MAAVALVDPDGRVLLAQRPEGKSMAGLWEFPGGKVEAGLAAPRAAALALAAPPRPAALPPAARPPDSAMPKPILIGAFCAIAGIEQVAKVIRRRSVQCLAKLCHGLSQCRHFAQQLVDPSRGAALGFAGHVLSSWSVRWLRSEKSSDGA